MDNPAVGSSFEDFLREDWLHTEVAAAAVSRALAWQIDQARRDQGLTKSALAERMRTSRSQLDRLLDPDNPQVQLETLMRAADALGKRLVVEHV